MPPSMRCSSRSLMRFHVLLAAHRDAVSAWTRRGARARTNVELEEIGEGVRAVPAAKDVQAVLRRYHRAARPALGHRALRLHRGPRLGGCVWLSKRAGRRACVRMSKR